MGVTARGRSVVRGLGATRIALGAGLVLAPGVSARAWFGRDDAGLRLVLRSIGARDVALGAGLLAQDDHRTWLVAGVAAVVVDTVASALAIVVLPASKLAPGTAMAAAFAAAGAWAVRRG